MTNIDKNKKLESIKQIINNRNDKIKAKVFIDYENVKSRLKEYNVSPIEDINFFGKLLEHFSKQGLNIINAVSYAVYKASEQSDVQLYCVDTKNSVTDGKNSSDIEMAVDIMKTLYTENDIEVYIIVASDRDYVPVIKNIKEKNKIAYMLSTRNGFNEIVKNYLDYHEYIEVLFDFDKLGYSLGKEHQIRIGIDIDDIKPDEKPIVENVCKLFYSSYFWTNYNKKGDLVGLDGYIKSLLKDISMKGKNPSDLNRYFHIAHSLEYVTLFQKNNMIYIREGLKNNNFIEDNINKKLE